MAITLRADNRALTKNAKYSYLTQNYASAQSSVVVDNSNLASANDYALFGEFGSETAEIVQISTVTSATHTLNLATNTIFAHAESTKITIIPYNQVRFYHTATATYATDTLLSTENIQADSTHTIYQDTSNTTGFGWFVFYNSTSTDLTSNSNAIPYAGFGENSVKKIRDNFFSLLNNKEARLISDDEFFSWLNEAYSICINELNLVNKEFNVEASESISVVSGTSEYSMSGFDPPFSDVVSIYDETNNVYVEKIKLSEVDDWDENSGNTAKYYLRGSVVGFSPQPGEDVTMTMKYISTSPTLTSYYDNIDLPTNNYYFLKDYLMYRAIPKLNRGNAELYFNNFNMGIQRMKMVSHKRDNYQDRWEVADSANV